jgi:hypothetical protein
MACPGTQATLVIIQYMQEQQAHTKRALSCTAHTSLACGLLGPLSLLAPWPRQVLHLQHMVLLAPLSRRLHLSSMRWSKAHLMCLPTTPTAQYKGGIGAPSPYSPRHSMPVAGSCGSGLLARSSAIFRAQTALITPDPCTGRQPSLPYGYARSTPAPTLGHPSGALPQRPPTLSPGNSKPI